MSITLANARLAVRVVTGLGAAQQITDAEMDYIFDVEYRRARREISKKLPWLYEATSTYANSVTGILAIPSDFERPIKLEYVLTDGTLVPVPQGNGVNEGQPAKGTFKLTYVQAPVVGYTTMDVPAGLEDVIVQRVAAQVQVRRKQDPSPHLSMAEATWKAQVSALRRPVGGGLIEVVDCPFNYVQRGTDLVVTENAENWG